MQEHNDVLLTKPHLTAALDDLSSRLLHCLGFPVRLVIHGGAVMVLHRSLRCRQHTRDVDYCHRSFVNEMAKRGMHDAGDRLLACITNTARRFDLGADWMNSHADVALPMAFECVCRIQLPFFVLMTTAVLSVHPAVVLSTPSISTP